MFLQLFETTLPELTENGGTPKAVKHRVRS